jgi:hypothetical protein
MGLAILKQLVFQKAESCLVGGKCLELRGLRKSEDWDRLISPSILEDLIQKFPNHLKISHYETSILVFDNDLIYIEV